MPRNSEMTIRLFEEQDWSRLWPFLQSTFAAGDTYAFPTDMREADIRKTWIEAPLATFVAVDADGTVLGSYYLRANFAGPGAHVSNCGYVVSPAARGRGVAAAMCRHSQEFARAQGFRAMQFNCVVSTNEVAVELWIKLGFEVVGRLPGAFKHAELGYVDAYVMFKTLVEDA